MVCKDVDGVPIVENDLVRRVSKKAGHYATPKGGEKCVVIGIDEKKLYCRHDGYTKHTSNKYKRFGEYKIVNGVSRPEIPTEHKHERSVVPLYFIHGFNIYVVVRHTNHGGNSDYTDYYATSEFDTESTRKRFNPRYVQLTRLNPDKTFPPPGANTTTKNINNLDFYLEIQSEDYLKASLQKICDHWYYLINDLKYYDNASNIINGLKNAEYKITLLDIIDLLDHSEKHKIILLSNT